MLLEDSNSVANRLESMVKKQIDFKELAKIYANDRENADKIVSEILDKIYSEFLATLSEHKTRELEDLVLFYVNDRLPKRTNSSRAINNELVNADYYLSNAVSKYVSEHLENKNQLNNNSSNNFSLRKTEKNVKELSKIEKIGKNNPEKAKKLFQMFLNKNSKNNEEIM